MPSTWRPRPSWNARTARSVPSSKHALLVTSKPPRFSRSCSSRTAAPRAPGRSSVASTVVDRTRALVDELGELFEQLRLALGADESLLHFAVAEHEQRRDAHHVEATGDVRV